MPLRPLIINRKNINKEKVEHFKMTESFLPVNLQLFKVLNIHLTNILQDKMYLLKQFSQLLKSFPVISYNDQRWKIWYFLFFSLKTIFFVNIEYCSWPSKKMSFIFGFLLLVLKILFINIHLLHCTEFFLLKNFIVKNIDTNTTYKYTM